MNCQRHDSPVLDFSTHMPSTWSSEAPRATRWDRNTRQGPNRRRRRSLFLIRDGAGWWGHDYGFERGGSTSFIPRVAAKVWVRASREIRDGLLNHPRWFRVSGGGLPWSLVGGGSDREGPPASDQARVTRDRHKWPTCQLARKKKKREWSGLARGLKGEMGHAVQFPEWAEWMESAQMLGFGLSFLFSVFPPLFNF
jgi:hypothetical protein